MSDSFVAHTQRAHCKFDVYLHSSYQHNSLPIVELDPDDAEYLENHHKIYTLGLGV